MLTLPSIPRDITNSVLFYSLKAVLEKQGCNNLHTNLKQILVYKLYVVIIRLNYGPN